jgi:hypothetical protein
VLKFNMGCGRNHRAGFINVDAMASSDPDEVADLETTPWPWADNCADEVVFNHSLEHMGGDPKVFLGIMSELYRICAPGALVRINVPDPRHNHFRDDPTHVRAITPATLQLFNRELNEDWNRRGLANSPLALYAGVDFKIESYQAKLAEPYFSQRAAGEMTQAQLEHAIQAYNNVVEEWRVVLVARKPAAGAA